MKLAVALHAKLKTASNPTALAEVASLNVSPWFVSTCARVIGARRCWRSTAARGWVAAAVVVEIRECYIQFVGQWIRINTGLREECFVLFLYSSATSGWDLQNASVLPLSRRGADGNCAYFCRLVASGTLAQLSRIRFRNLADRGKFIFRLWTAGAFNYLLNVAKPFSWWTNWWRDLLRS